jgi:hypothetical protein
LLIEQRRARAHKAHVPRQNAPQLRQLVQAALAQERTNGRQVRAGISQQMSSHRRRAHPHAAELRHFENHIVPTNAVRPIQDGAFGRQPDDHRHQQHRHKQNQGRQTAQKNIESFFITIDRIFPL